MLSGWGNPTIGICHCININCETGPETVLLQYSSERDVQSVFLESSNGSVSSVSFFVFLSTVFWILPRHSNRNRFDANSSIKLSWFCCVSKAMFGGGVSKIEVIIVAPQFDAQCVLSTDLFPTFLVDLKAWYAQEYGDYLVSEKPHFFVGLIWLELLFAWPLSIFNLYGIATGKSWVSTTCLLYGTSSLTATVAALAEQTLSKRAPEKVVMIYYTFLGFAGLAMLRGLLPSNKRPAALSRKKKKV